MFYELFDDVFSSLKVCNEPTVGDERIQTVLNIYTNLSLISTNVRDGLTL